MKCPKCKNEILFHTMSATPRTMLICEVCNLNSGLEIKKNEKKRRKYRERFSNYIKRNFKCSLMDFDYETTLLMENIYRLKHKIRQGVKNESKNNSE